MSGLIRVAEEGDAQAIAEIYAPAITDAVISFELTPPDAKEISRRMLAIQRQYPWLVYEESKTVLGYVYASVHNERAAYRWSVDASVYVDASFRQGGVGRGLYGLSLIHI